MERVSKREWYEMLWSQLQRNEEVKTAVILSGPYLGARIMRTDEITAATSEAPEAFWANANPDNWR